MPVLTRLRNFIIRMFYKDHPPPHFHVTNNDRNGLFDLDNLEMFKGNLSQKEQKEIKNWAKDKQENLKEMWKTQKIKKLN